MDKLFMHEVEASMFGESLTPRCHAHGSHVRQAGVINDYDSGSEFLHKIQITARKKGVGYEDSARVFAMRACMTCRGISLDCMHRVRVLFCGVYM